MRSRSCVPMRTSARRCLVAVVLTLPLGLATVAWAEHRPTATSHAPKVADAEAGNPFSGMATLERVALVTAVLERNPTIEAAHAAWRAAEARPCQAGALEDPMLTYSLAPASIGAADLPFGQVIDFSQRIPFPGKRALRASAASDEARAMKDDYEGARRDVALMASTLFDDYYVVTRSLEIKGELDRLLDNVKRSAQAGYASGRGAQASLIRIDIEKTHIEHDKIMLISEREVIEGRINALLHRAPAAVLPPPPLHMEILGTADVELASLQDMAMHRAEVAAADARIDAADATARLARREYLPDFGAGASYNSMWDDPEHRVMVGVSLNLPLQFGRRSAAVDEAEAELMQRRSERAAIIDRIAADVEATHHTLLAADHVVSLYDERLIPAARDSVASARAAFETGNADLDLLLEAERALRDAELSSVSALADRNRRYAELQRTVGQMPGTDGEEPR